MNTKNYTLLHSDFSEWPAIIDYIFDNTEGLMEFVSNDNDLNSLRAKIEELRLEYVLAHLEDLINDYGFCKVNIDCSGYESDNLVTVHVNGKHIYNSLAFEDLHNDFLSEEKSFFRKLLNDCLFNPIY